MVAGLILAMAEFLEREAGYCLVSLAVIAGGLVLMDPAQRAQVSHDLVVFGIGVLARSMGSKKGAPE